MKTKITKVVAVVAAVLMLMTLVPVAALPEVNWPALSSVFGGNSADDTATTPAAMPVDELTALETEGYYQDTDGNVYVDLDGDGEAEIIQGDTVSDEDFWESAVLGKDTTTNGVEYNAEGDEKVDTTVSKVDMTKDNEGNFIYQYNAYEPASTKNEDHPFLPYGDAWINLSSIYYGAPATPEYPYAKWSANTSVFNTTGYDRDGDGVIEDAIDTDNDGTIDVQSEFTFPDVNVISEFWKGHAVVEGRNSQYERLVVGENGKQGYAYSRYDAMQGKWGLRLDKNVDELTLGDKNYAVAKFNLADTPYLYYSTEMTDAMQIAISLMITDPNGKSQWFTITDNLDRPGVANESRELSMIPSVTVSDYYTKDTDGNYTTTLKPLELGKSQYVTGSITGCIDFSMLMDMIHTNKGTNGSNNGRDGMWATVNYVNIRVQPAINKATNKPYESEATHINYLYFGPNYGSIFTPQVNKGPVNKEYTKADNRESNNGWDNGQLVKVENTPKDGQVITIDTTNIGNYTYAEHQGNYVYKTLNKDGTEVTAKTTDVAIAKHDKNNVNYVTVSIPVRKWIDVLSDSRKLVMTVNVDQSTVQTVTTSKQTSKDVYENISEELNPCVSLWGNPGGSVGSKPSYEPYEKGKNEQYAIYGEGTTPLEGGTRQSYENILGILGRGAYLVEPRFTFGSTTVDRTLGNTTKYDGTESWYDLLRSPYMYDDTVTQPEESFKTTKMMIGYTFITSIRVCVPVGTKLTISNMHCEGNSAGLNMYNTNGDVVDYAYDGGSGVHPVVNLDTTQGGYGNVGYSTLPAAYAPYTQYSNYTVYNLIYNSATKPQIGRIYENTSSDLYYAITKYPGASYDGHGNVVLANRYKSDTFFMVYGVFRNTSNGNKYYGLVSYMKEDGTTDFGWVCLSNATKQLDAISERELVFEDYGTYEEGVNDTSSYIDRVYEELSGTWQYSRFFDNANLRFSDGADNTVSNSIVNGYYATADTLFYKHGNKYYPTLPWANMYHNKSDTSSNSHYAIKQFEVETGTKANSWILSNNETTNDGKAWSIGISKSLSNPVRLKKGGEKDTYPVLKYDIQNKGDADNRSGTFVLALTIEVDGDLRLFYLDPSSGVLNESIKDVTNKNGADTARTGEYGGTYCNAVSLQPLIDAHEGKVITVVGLSVFMYNPETVLGSSLTFRNLEILVEEEPWIDELNVKKLGNTTANVSNNVKMYDGFNVLNDAYYYNHQYDNYGEPLTDDRKYYDKHDVGGEYGKKGWTGDLFVYNKDGSLIGGNPYGNGYPSGNYPKTQEDSNAEKLYEYKTALGHMRIWLNKDTHARLELRSKRSYNMKEYRYLYYSYAMRNVKGLTAQPQDGVNGFEIVVKEEVGSSWANYVENTDKWNFMNSSDYDNREISYNTAINAVVDLHNLSNRNDAPINEIDILLNNATGERAEFYINYIYLSNEPPIDNVKKIHNTTEYQYYYMMDNTGDRYSARFPTVDNPTGSVSDVSPFGDASRVNPIRVERGKTITHGTFFNGDDLDAASGVSGTDAIEAIWFYTDQNDTTYPKSYDEITEYYRYKERDNSGTQPDVYDMRWSLGRWYDGGGANSMNVLEMDRDTTNPSGNLLLRYATDDRVLLRAGIEPIRELTYYDANEGQYVYENSSDKISEGVMLNENNYYITDSPIQWYFTWPVKGNSSAALVPVRPGYKFAGWYSQENIFENDDGEFTDKLFRYYRNDTPNENHFKALWENDTTMENDVYNVRFYTSSDDALSDYNNDAYDKPSSLMWFKRTTSYTVTSKCDRFEMIIPSTTWIRINGTPTAVRGWQIYDPATGETGQTVFRSGETITVTKDVCMIPVLESATSGNTELPVKITVNNGVELYLFNEMNGDHYVTTAIPESGLHGIRWVENSDGGRTYFNLPMNVVLVAKAEKGDNMGWMVSNTNNGNAYNQIGTGMTGSVVGVGTNFDGNSDDVEYKFTAYCNMNLTYTSVIGTDDKNYGANEDGVVVSAMGSYINKQADGSNSREMIFVSQVTVPTDKYEIVAAGTLYTKNDKFAALDAMDGKVDNIVTQNMVLKVDTDNTLENIAKMSQPKGANDHTRAVNTSKWNSSGQYYLMVTETKGNAVTYYARPYVIYKDKSGTYYVAYGNIVLSETLSAANQTTGLN